MARTGRGGYQKPSGGARVSGVGKQSKRSDASQPIRTANVQEGTDLTQGDRQKLEAAQRMRPLGRTPSPQVRPQRMSPDPRSQTAELPQSLFEMPTNRPLEPETAGLGMGPGAGPEALRTAEDPTSNKEAALMMLMRLDSGGASEALQQMLQDMRAERAPAPQPMPVVQSEPMPEIAEEAMEPNVTDIELPEGGDDERTGVPEEETGTRPSGDGTAGDSALRPSGV